MNPRILIIGANGQIGTDLGHALAARYGAAAVALSDIAAPPTPVPAGMTHHILDATDADALQRLVVQPDHAISRWVLR
jgi:nucleoside-diphosphate-sugar epimerase